MLGISSDVLYPLAEQEALHAMIPGSEFFVINSNSGHGECNGYCVERLLSRAVTESKGYCVERLPSRAVTVLSGY